MRPKIAKLKVNLARIHPILLGLSTLALVATDCGLPSNANPLSTDLTPSLSTSSISLQDLAHSSLTSPSQVAQVQTSQTQITQAIPIKRIEVIGSTIFDADKLDPIIKPLEGKEVTEDQLTVAANAITQLYVSNGYVTSQALYTPQSVVDLMAWLKFRY